MKVASRSGGGWSVCHRHQPSPIPSLHKGGEQLPRFTILCYRALVDRLALWRLPRQKECLDQFAFTANNHAGETLIPFSHWYLRFCIQPCCEQFKLSRIYLAFLDAVKQMLKERRRQIVPAYFGHDLLDPVEAPSNLFPQFFGLFCVLRCSEFPGEQRKLSGT